MITGTTISDIEKMEIIPGIEHFPVFARLRSNDACQDLNIFLTYSQAIELSRLLRIAAGVDEAASSEAA